MKILAILVVVSLTACSGADESEPCSQSHRDGTYLQHLEERANGSCGPASDQVIELSPGGSALPPGCAFDADDRISVDQCGSTRMFTCPLDGVPGSVSVTAVTSEQDAGAKIAGIFTMTIHDGDGAFVCKSTYDMTAIRQ